MKNKVLKILSFILLGLLAIPALVYLIISGFIESFVKARQWVQDTIKGINKEYNND